MFERHQRLNIDDHEHILILYNLPSMKKKAIQELHGLAAAVIYDGHVSEQEIQMIVEWLDKYPYTHDEWPVSRLIELLHDILADGIITTDERLELLNFFAGISSAPCEENNVVKNIFSENPVIAIPHNCFLFTGKLQFGRRNKAESMVLKLGGFCCNNYNNSVDYLVVGELGQEAWKYSRYGRKIEACMNARTKGLATTDIIREIDFIKAAVAQNPED